MEGFAAVKKTRGTVKRTTAHIDHDIWQFSADPHSLVRAHFNLPMARYTCNNMTYKYRVGNGMLVIITLQTKAMVI